MEQERPLLHDALSHRYVQKRHARIQFTVPPRPLHPHPHPHAYRSSLSFSFSATPSARESEYHDAFQRLDSLSSSVDASMTAREALAEDPGDALNARRRRSLRMMESMSLNDSCKDAIHDVLLTFISVGKDGRCERARRDCTPTPRTHIPHPYTPWLQPRPT